MLFSWDAFRDNFSMQMNVSSECIDACSFHLDMDNIMDRPECMNDFEKLMKCAADGSGKLEIESLVYIFICPYIWFES